MGLRKEKRDSDDLLKAKQAVERHYMVGEGEWMRTNLDGVGYLIRAYSSLRALALNAAQRKTLVSAIAVLEGFYGGVYDQHLISKGAL